MKLLMALLIFVAGGADAQAWARAQTTPIPSGPTAANDTAIWVHPTDPSRSLVFGTDQFAGSLYSYRLDGGLHQRLNLGPTLAVDVRYGVRVGGILTDVVLAANLDGTFRLLGADRDAGMLTPVDLAPTRTGFNASAASFYSNLRTGQLVVYVADSTGSLRQYSIRENSGGKLVSSLDRTVSLAAPVNGVAADDRGQRLFLTLANRGLYTLEAQSDGNPTPTLVDSVSAGRLAGAAGVALYFTADGGGYAIVSASESSRFPVYALGTGAYVSSFNIVAGDAGIRGAAFSRGIEVVALSLGAPFEKGLFVAHDPTNPTIGPNYKLVPWENIANATTPGLAVDPRFDPRSAPRLDAGPPGPQPGTKCPILSSDAGSADAGACIDNGAGSRPPPFGGESGVEEPRSCSCGQVGVLTPILALALLILRRRRTRTYRCPAAN